MGGFQDSQNAPREQEEKAKQRILVKITLKDASKRHAIEVHMDRNGFAFKQDKLIAHEKMIPHISKKLVEVVPITFNDKTTFQSLVDKIMPRVVAEPDVWRVVEQKWKASAVEVRRNLVVWNGLDSPTTENDSYPYSDQNCLTEILVHPSQDERLRMVLKKRRRGVGRIF